METLRRRLEERERRGEPVRVGLVGAGQMGLGLAAVLGRMPGMRLVAVADLLLDRALDAFRHGGVRRDEIEEAGTAAGAHAALAQGKRIVTSAGELIPDLPVDVVVDATGIPLQAALTAARAIEAGRHIVLLTVEADVTVGHLLARRAAEAGVVYSGAAGDEPAATKELVDFARFLGFEVVCAGKGKNNPLDRRATAQSLEAEGRARGHAGGAGQGPHSHRGRRDPQAAGRGGFRHRRGAGSLRGDPYRPSGDPGGAPVPQDRGGPLLRPLPTVSPDQRRDSDLHRQGRPGPRSHHCPPAATHGGGDRRRQAGLAPGGTAGTAGGRHGLRPDRGGGDGPLRESAPHGPGPQRRGPGGTRAGPADPVGRCGRRGDSPPGDAQGTGWDVGQSDQ
ncbi:MAG: hypothetical protein HY766_06070 [candidate division NC10 bacterium]|nr:hypothetical protein [candidate division NC10 bacterium]